MEKSKTLQEQADALRAKLSGQLRLGDWGTDADWSLLKTLDSKLDTLCKSEDLSRSKHGRLLS